MAKYDLKHKLEEVKEGSPEMPYYPSISISTEDVEGLTLKMGQKVKLVGEVTGMDKHKGDKTRYSIDVVQLNEGISEEEYMEMPDEKKDEVDAKDLEEKAEKKEEEK